jgi:hypothetical protein
MTLKFGLILGGVTIGTLILIFGVYKIFLDKPGPSPLPSPVLTTRDNTAAESLPVSSEAPRASTKPTGSVKPTTKPTPFKSSIGTLTVLQDNTDGVNQTTAGSSAISGSISLVGSPPAGTSIVIVARKTGTTESFKTVVSGIAAASNSKWTWSTAIIGSSYDLIAILKGSSNGVDTDYAASQTYVITAPALNQVFSLNASSAPSAPSGTATITCGTKAANNMWSANINFPSVDGAAYYKMQIGTTSGASDINSTSQAAQSGTNQIVNVTITDSVVYYAQYAIANVLNPTAIQYSGFSTPTTVKCP